MIRYQMFKPQSALADYVRFFWTLDIQLGDNEPFVHRALPDNCAELIFYVKGALSISSQLGPEGRTFASGIFGQADKFRQFKSVTSFSLFGVYLYPYSMKYLFGVPAEILSNEKVDSKTLWGDAGRMLEEQVISASSTQERVKIVSEFLLCKLRTLHSYEHAFLQQVKLISDTNAILSVTSFANECNLSRRQFERRFKEHSGFSPKEFFNITRFKKALHTMQNGKRSLAQTAIDSGYYDQSHFTNEFKRLSGYTPKEFVSNRQLKSDMRATRDFKD